MREIPALATWKSFFGVMSFFLLACAQKYDQTTETEAVHIFNGNDLAGWIGDTKVWRVEDQKIIGSTMQKLIDRAIWLVTEETFDDFELCQSS